MNAEWIDAFALGLEHRVYGWLVGDRVAIYSDHQAWEQGPKMSDDTFWEWIGDHFNG